MQNVGVIRELEKCVSVIMSTCWCLRWRMGVCLEVNLISGFNGQRVVGCLNGNEKVDYYVSYSLQQPREGSRTGV